MKIENDLQISNSIQGNMPLEKPESQLKMMWEALKRKYSCCSWVIYYPLFIASGYNRPFHHTLWTRIFLI